jgi:large subunit ribosomal protein L1
MGKIRVAKLGDEGAEKEQKRKAEARRQTKDSKKTKVEGVGLKGGQRVSVVEGTDINPEFKKLIEEVESGEKPEDSAKKKAKKEKKIRVRSKRYIEKASLIEKNKLYPVSEAVALVKQTSLTKFDGTVEMHISLNIQMLGEKKDLRGAVSLPHGTGKEVKVVVADEKIIEEITAGKINFDILVAHPTMMPKLAKVARILGPKGLMPNPKNGTVSEDTDKRVKELSHGQVNFKTETDQPLIHMIVGKVSFDEKKLTDNISAVIKAIGANKISKITIAATMGPGVKLAIA